LGFANSSLLILNKTIFAKIFFGEKMKTKSEKFVVSLLTIVLIVLISNLPSFTSNAGYYTDVYQYSINGNAYVCSTYKSSKSHYWSSSTNNDISVITAIQTQSSSRKNYGSTTEEEVTLFSDVYLTQGYNVRFTISGASCNHKGSTATIYMQKSGGSKTTAVTLTVNATGGDGIGYGSTYKDYYVPSSGYYTATGIGEAVGCDASKGHGIWTTSTYDVYKSVYTPYTYTVSYYGNGATSGSSTSVSVTEGYNTTAKSNWFTKTGYTFKGWATSSSGSVEYTAGQSFTPSSSMSLYAVWEEAKDVNYTVKHYKQNTDGSSYTLASSSTYTGTSGSSVTPSVNSYTGFNSPSTQTVTLASDGSTVVNYYYARNSYTVTYKDVVDSTSGTLLGSSTASKVYGSTVRGSDKGSNTTDNAYYNGYYYVSDTSATVSTSGATVYRIFKLRTIDISGIVKWVDKDNQYGSRPDSITVYLLKNGSQVNSSSGLTENNENSFNFTNLPKYDSSGDAITYTVSQSDAVSKNAPEDKYTTNITGDMMSGFVITNTLQNNVEETGFTVKGSIIWEDNNNRLGYRPESVIINLYMDGELLKSVTKDKNATDYAFENLERYVYNDDSTVKETHTYQIEEVMNPVPSYVVDGETEEAYTITYSLPKIDTKDGSGIINITNTFNNAEDIIPVKPYDNSLTVKTNKEAYTEIILRKMDADYVDNEVVYKDSYSDVYYNLEINNIAETISHIVAGKYEITTTSQIFAIENVELSDNEYVSLVEEDDKYYVIIEETPHDAYGTVIINLVKKEHEGYQSEISIMNYWKTNISEKTNVNTKSKMSRRLVVPNDLEENLENIKTESEIEESEINYSEEELENNEII
jgi:uncharacterized repeat protein (TIGR02543 family)